VLGIDPSSGLTRVSVGRGELRAQALDIAAGARIRVQLLARDLIVATQEPRHLSVRNVLSGVVASVTSDELDSELIAIDVGGVLVMARVTTAAARELGLIPGLPVWVLVKAVSLRAHSFAAPHLTSRARPSA
jgi:molybdate transport system ATP-binding protein